MPQAGWKELLIHSPLGPGEWLVGVWAGSWEHSIAQVRASKATITPGMGKRFCKWVSKLSLCSKQGSLASVWQPSFWEFTVHTEWSCHLFNADDITFEGHVKRGFVWLIFIICWYPGMKGDTVNECVNETVSSVPHLNPSQLCRSRIALTQSVPFLHCRELYSLQVSPTPNYCVSAACLSEHSTRPVLEFLPFCVCRMPAFFLQWSSLSRKKFQYHIDELGRVAVLEAGTNCKDSQVHLRNIASQKLNWAELWMKITLKCWKHHPEVFWFFPLSEAIEISFLCQHIHPERRGRLGAR